MCRLLVMHVPGDALALTWVWRACPTPSSIPQRAMRLAYLSIAIAAFSFNVAPVLVRAAPSSLNTGLATRSQAASTREVVDPLITSPTAETVWIVGNQYAVTW